MQGWKNDNDPWEPLPDQGKDSGSDLSPVESRIKVPFPCPQDPLHNIIDSQQYIQTLEKKLDRLKKKKENPSSKDIIDSLALFHDDQMRNYMSSETSPAPSDNIEESGRNVTSSYMKRKLFPELQAVSATELVELVTDDFVEKAFEKLTVEENPTPECEQTKIEDMYNTKSVLKVNDFKEVEEKSEIEDTKKES